MTAEYETYVTRATALRIGPRAVNDWGLTAREASEHESLADRSPRELPETMAGDGDGLGDATDTDGELNDDQVGLVRSGRLVEDIAVDADCRYLYAVDLGLDGAVASAGEASIHVLPDRYETHLDE
jgi:hypothetical protein